MAAVAYDHLKNLIVENDMNQADFANFLGRTAAVVTNLFNGSRKLKLDEAEKISARFGVSLDYVLHGKAHGAPIMKIFIRGTVPGGLPVECMEERGADFIYYPIRGNPKNIIALRVIGNSMNNIAPDGSFIIVDTSKKNAADLDGKPIVAYANGESTFKRLYLNPPMLVPDSTDKTFKPVVLNGEWSIIGAAVGTINPLA